MAGKPRKPPVAVSTGRDRMDQTSPPDDPIGDERAAAPVRQPERLWPRVLAVLAVCYAVWVGILVWLVIQSA